MVSWGFDVSMFEQNNEVDVYYDIWNSFEVFNAMGTQWNVGYAGPVGLRYEGIREVCFYFGITEDEELRDIFKDIKIMERVALDIMHKEKK